MKAFVSSVISGFTDFRESAQSAVLSLGHEVIRAEDFGASSESPRVACLEGVRRADIVILLLGQRYGAKQSGGLSATHEEFREARDRKEVLAFVQRGAHEPEQDAFIREVQEWNNGLFTEEFGSVEELRSAVTRVLHRRLVDDARGSPNEAELLERTQSLLPQQDRGWSRGNVSAIVAIAASPRQPILRPSEIESATLADGLFRIALTGDHPIFDRRERTETEVVDNVLNLRQETRSLALHGDGSLVLSVSLATGEHQMALIEEDVSQKLRSAIALSNDILSEIDATGRIRQLCIATAIEGASHLGWRTETEERRHPNSIQLGRAFGERAPVFLQPPIRARAVLRTQSSEIADDLMVLLRRQFR